MSKTEKEVSKEVQEDQENGSVFDFLYNDTRRVSSFLSQFDPSGYMDKIVHRDGVVKSRKRGFKVGLGGGASIVGTGGQGSVSFEKGPSDEGSESLERSYDPLWANAIALLDYLDERGIIRRGLSEARIGHFVLVKGQIMLLDLAMLKGAWEKGPIQKLIRNGMQDAQPEANRAERRKQSSTGKSQTNTAFEQTELLVSLLSIFPHSIQARMIAANVNVWSTLDADSIVGKSGDLILKHGTLIGGEWSMLGVLDAFPYDPEFKLESGEDEGDMFARIAETGVGALAARLAPAARAVMGRPPSAFGMTPLLIFRDVSGSDESEPS